MAVHYQRHLRPHQSFVNKAYSFGAPIGTDYVFLAGVGGRNFLVTLLIDFYYLHLVIVVPAIGVLRTFLGLGAGIELVGRPIGGALIVHTVLVGERWRFKPAVVLQNGSFLSVAWIKTYFLAAFYDYVRRQRFYHMIDKVADVTNIDFTRTKV